MPQFDQTGPQGQGSRTGRGMGPCGRGFWSMMGFGRRRNLSRGLCGLFGGTVPQTKEEKLEDLKRYKQALTEELEEVEKDLSSDPKQQ